MDDSQKHFQEGNQTHKNVHTICLHFLEVQKQVKQIYGGRNQKTVPGLKTIEWSKIKKFLRIS